MNNSNANFDWNSKDKKNTIIFHKDNIRLAQKKIIKQMLFDKHFKFCKEEIDLKSRQYLWNLQYAYQSYLSDKNTILIRILCLQLRKHNDAS